MKATPPHLKHLGIAAEFSDVIAGWKKSTHCSGVRFGFKGFASRWSARQDSERRYFSYQFAMVILL
ncbi:hypothetical protein [Oleiharenicola lentus]|uniref:hypothetical protein n=1 Tax=Oleiharenicola lentus TaxID=2508720 RepID=UPI003F672790